MADPTLPPKPTYVGASSGGSTSSSTTGATGGDDIFNLGSLYNQPIFLGTGTKPVDFKGPGDLRESGGPTAPINQFGTTQDLLESVLKLWAAQTAERKANPDKATGYEQLQRALFAAGFYGQTGLDKVHLGQWTQQTRAALRNALGSYEQATNGGKIPQTFVDFLGANQGLGAADEAATPKPVVQLSDPLQIRSAAQQAALQALGHKLDDDQLSQFVSSFQRLQSSAEQTETGSAAMPDLSSQADAFVQANNGGDYEAHQRTSYTNALVNLLMGSQARPTIQPVAPAA